MHARYLLLTLLALTAPLMADPVWIDVRSGLEYRMDHLDGALLMPHGQIGELIEQAVPARDTEIHLYCRSGRRAGAAMATLHGLGYTRITNHGTLEAARQARAEQAPAMTACTPAAGEAAC